MIALTLGLAFGVALGLGLGLAFAWHVARRAEHEARGAAAREAEHQQRFAAQARELREEADRRAVAETTAARLAPLELELESRRASETELRERIAALATELENERRASGEKLAVVERAREELGQAFRAASAEALKNNSEAFLAHAEEKLAKYQEAAKGELEKRGQAIDLVMKPVKETLEKVGKEVQELEKARAGAYAGLSEQVRSLAGTQEQLRTETASLVKALRQPMARGQWGEVQLRRVVELAGMVEHCDFELQATTASPDGALRPDMIVRLPGSKRIVVDSKVPLAAYLDAMEAPDDGERRRHLEGHARQLRNHLEKLGKKRYWEHVGESPEFVVAFIPNEAIFRAAFEEDPSLLEVSVDQGVIPASPMTLIPLLRTIQYCWRQEALAENAKHVSDLGAELYKRLADMTGHFAKVGGSLGKAVEAYNKALGSFEARVLVTARKFGEQGALPQDADIDSPDPVETLVRSLQVPEHEASSEQLGLYRSA